MRVFFFFFRSDASQVLEYMGGGDLLNLLIERDTFPEDFTRFYVAEVQRLLSQCWNRTLTFYFCR